MEVVITKANISRSLRLQLPSTSQLFYSLFAVQFQVPCILPTGDTVEGMPMSMAAPVWVTVHVWALYYEIIWCPADVQ